MKPFTIHELLHDRATDAATRDKTMARFDDSSVTYREFAERALAWGALLLGSVGNRPPQVAVLMKNNLEFLDCYGGVAFSGGTLFGINTGLGGDVLRAVIEASGAEIVVVDREHRAPIDAIRPTLTRLARVIEVGSVETVGDLARIRSELGERLALAGPGEEVTSQSPFCVVYTSGTTGLPKGVINSHGKIRGIGAAMAGILRLSSDDVGYVSMPLFHSNAIFMNWVPGLTVGASVALRERFTASGFVSDVFRYGATFWNYVGQPVHYVLEAVSRAYDGDEARILAAVRDDPRNRMRIATGTGASGRERRRFIDWFGLEHVYETYGSTEAEISAWCFPGDPIDSVGQLNDDNVFIQNEQGAECDPLELDARGNPTNVGRAVGEIVRRGTTGLFQGYHGLPDASARKVQAGIYHSGDLGAISRVDGKRYLYFFGRTDDWIRKDGENFGADSVVDLIQSWPRVDLAAAYGVPHPVSDEWVMVAIKLKRGENFDPAELFQHCQREVESGRDAKWIPDFVRLVDDFEWTETHKIRVKSLKRDFYHPERAGAVYMRQRGDTTFRQLTETDFRTLLSEFERTGRTSLFEI